MPTIQRRTQPNHLYRLRRIRGFGQKQLAYLLGYRDTSTISRLEHGHVLPPLAVGLLLQLALGAQLSEIYPALNEEAQQLILKRASRLPPALGRGIRGRILGRD